MKVGLITLFRNNYGSILQCYATCEFLKSQGYECEVLSEKCEKETIMHHIVRWCKNILRSMLYRDYLKNKIKMKKAMIKEGVFLSSKTKEKMDDFISSRFTVREITLTDLKKNMSIYDYYVIGSDQVWNASREISDFYFLSFVNEDKKIALAPSIGVDKIPSYNKKIQKKICSFKKLSLREETAVRIISSFYNGEIVRVGDPTLLIETDDWRKLSDSILCKEDDFILLHFLNAPCDNALKNIKKYEDNSRYAIIAIGYKHCEYNIISNIKFIDASPEEYISLIDNAEIVFTDSFHSSLFCINMETEFFCYERQYLHGKSQTSRITDMLNRYGYSERFIRTDSCLPINKKRISNISLNYDRQRLKLYLLDELGK